MYPDAGGPAGNVDRARGQNLRDRFDILLGLCQRDRLIIDRAAVGGLCRYCEWGAGDSSLDSDRRRDGRRCVYRPGVDRARQDGGSAIIVSHSGRDGAAARDPFPIVDMEDIAAGKFGISSSKEDTSDLQSLMLEFYADSCFE